MTGNNRYLYPKWPVPGNVCSVISTRQGGVSSAPYTSNNMALHVGDEFEQVQKNRQVFVDDNQLPECLWLNQTHSTQVLNTSHIVNNTQALNSTQTQSGESHNTDRNSADACITRSSKYACVIMTADCLPLLVCDRQGHQVAAIHAGWRGLADGIIARTVSNFTAPAKELLIYLGPAISQKHFEVGVEVLDRFLIQEQALGTKLPKTAFLPNQKKPKHYFADLYTLAKWQLKALGVSHIFGGQYCTFSQKDRFYSYRRDQQCGRIVSAIWISQGPDESHNS